MAGKIPLTTVSDTWYHCHEVMYMAQRGSPKVTVRLPAELLQRLQQIAQEHKTTVSEIIRMAAVTAAQAFDSVEGSGKK